MDPPAGRARLDAVDALRGLAAVAVVAFHVGFATNGEWLAPRPLPGDLDFGVAGAWRLLNAGSTGVHLFFVVSGFCLHLPWARDPDRPFPAGPFLLRRALRILPLYWAILAVAVALDPGRSVALHAVMLHNLLFPELFDYIPPMWSLPVEVQLYGLYVLLRVAGVRRWTRAWAVSVVVAIAWGTWAVGQGASPIGVDENVSALFAWPQARASEFLAGAVLAEWWARGRRPPPLIVALAVLVLGQLAAEWTWAWPARDPLHGLGYALLVGWCLGHWHPGRLLVWVGQRSYSLYLVHFPLLLPGAWLGLKIWTPAGWWGTALVMFTGCLVLSLVLSAVLYRVLERPSHQWGRALTREAFARRGH